MPEHDGPAAGAEVAVGEVQVGVAHAGRADPHEHLAGPRLVELDALHGERPAGLVEDGRADLHHATRRRSSASRSGSTPSPGPGGGAIVPSGAIVTGAGRSQSRRSGDQAGGS